MRWRIAFSVAPFIALFALALILSGCARNGLGSYSSPVAKPAGPVACAQTAPGVTVCKSI